MSCQPWDGDSRPGSLSPRSCYVPTFLELDEIKVHLNLHVCMCVCLSVWRHARVYVSTYICLCVSEYNYKETIPYNSLLKRKQLSLIPDVELRWQSCATILSNLFCSHHFKSYLYSMPRGRPAVIFFSSPPVAFFSPPCHIICLFKNVLWSVNQQQKNTNDSFYFHNYF